MKLADELRRQGGFIFVFFRAGQNGSTKDIFSIMIIIAKPSSFVFIVSRHPEARSVSTQ